MQERGKGRFRVIGQPVIQRNAYNKVTGKQQFISDMYFPNSLWAVVVRSPRARADVQSIDTQAAFDCPGVVAVYTADDVPQRYFNTAAAPPSPQLDAAADRLLLTDQAQHVGDGVAVVVAKSRTEALAAAKAVRIDWDVLPPVLTLDEAVEQGNILGQVAYGEEEAVERAFAASELLIADTFRTSPVQHMCLEPHACAAALEQSNGHLTIWSNTQAPSDIRRLCAEILDFPLTQIRVCKIEEGGGFGCKQELHEEALVAWLATTLGQTVQLRYTREEEFTASRGRHGASVRVRLGFRRDGTLLACNLNAVLDSGAYASHAPYVIGNLGSAAVYLYPYATHRFQGLVVQTNTLTGGGYRGYGFPQAIFALEQTMDMAAQALQIDPVELRRRNAAQLDLPDPFFGDQSANRLQMCLDAGVQTFGWTDAQPVVGDDGRVRANGMATAALVSITSPDIHEASTTTLRWNEDGSVTVLIGSCDCGTGSSTVMAQIVAEELGLPLHTIDIREGDLNYIIHLRESDAHAAFLGFLRRRPCLVQAVHNLTFDLVSGEMVGFLGPNGAGKTTTLKMLTGLLQPTMGDVSVFGFVPWQRKKEFLRHITFVVGNRSQLWWDLPVADSFEIHRAIYRLRYEDYNTMRTTLTDLLELGPLLRKPVRTLSLGERMKCEFAVALLHRPQVLFLDEPTIGLDVPTQRRIRAFLSEYNRQFGATVLLTSHNMADIEALCQRVLVICNGELLFDGGLTQLVHSVSSQKVVTIKLDSTLTYCDNRGILESVLASFVDSNGQSVSSTLVGNAIRIRLPASQITSFMQQLFAVLPVVDVSIEDLPIEEVIEHIFTRT